MFCALRTMRLGERPVETESAFGADWRRNDQRNHSLSVIATAPTS